MRRFRRQPPPPSQSFLSGRDIRRMITMVGMLAVLWMMATRAADPKMWRFFATAPESKPSTQVAAIQSPASLTPAAAKDDKADGQANGKSPAASAAPAAKPKNEFAWETLDSSAGYEGPVDEDAEERDAAKEQFQAVSDKEELSAVDMPAYWRLMRWSRTQTFEQMEKRAKRGGVDVMFTHYAQEPERHRGELVSLKLHLKRVLTFEASKNSAGLTRMYEAWGVTYNDSRSNPYVLVFSEKPPQLPLGADNVDQEATFVGYFLKTMSYEAYDVRRWAPLLIGRLRWHENEAQTMLDSQKQDSRLFWPVAGIGLLSLVVVMSAWAWRLRHPKKRPQLPPESLEHQAVETWIDKAQQGELVDTPENGDDGSDSGRRGVANALDWIDPHRHNESS